VYALSLNIKLWFPASPDPSPWHVLSTGSVEVVVAQAPPPK
jgi:hypothetical protein